MNRADFTTSVIGQIDLIEEVIASCPQRGRILDIGTGAGLAARRFFETGWDVTATGYDMDAYLKQSPLPTGIRVVPDVDICDAHQFEDASFDAIWCAHVLEHISNTGLALEELRRLLKPDGLLFIAVPPHKEQVVGGHIHAGWNIGMLMYVLADAGFGLAEGRFVRHGYNIFGMVSRGPGRLSNGSLRRANGDIEALAEAGRFPTGFPAQQGFDGQRRSVNWVWQHPPEALPVRREELAAPPPVAPMRIGFFVPWITASRGGTENVGQMMANAMAARGHEVTIFTFDDKRGSSRWPLESSIKLVHLPEAENTPSNHLMEIEVASHNLDLLVGLHMNRTMLRYVRCAHRVGLPLVLSEHIDPRFPNWIGTFSIEERNLAMAGATRIHLLLEEFLDTLDLSIRERARVIPNTIPEPERLAEPGIDRSRRTLLAVSRLVPRKNQSQVIEAFAHLAADFPNWRLQIVGDGPQKAELVERADELGLSSQVEFAGEQENVYPFYADADLFVIPSLFEGFPLTLCEAMAHGLPAVGFERCAGVRSQIEPGRTGLLCQGSDTVNDLKQALGELMRDDAQRAAMGKSARTAFMTRFSNEIIHSAWEKLFAEALQDAIVLEKPSSASVTSVRLWEQVWGPISNTEAV